MWLSQIRGRADGQKSLPLAMETYNTSGVTVPYQPTYLFILFTYLFPFPNSGI